MMSRTRVFIVAPSSYFPEDKRHDVCTHNGSLAVATAYEIDAFELMRSFQSLAAAERYAKKKFGVERVKVI